MTDSDQGIVAKAPETMLSGLLEKELFFPDGLLGFADCRRYKFRRFDPGVAGASPVFILEAVEQDVSFPLIHPDFVWLDYRLEIAPEVMTCLDAASEQELGAAVDCARARSDRGNHGDSTRLSDHQRGFVERNATGRRGVSAATPAASNDRAIPWTLPTESIST